MAVGEHQSFAAVIASVAEESPAWEAGFEAGCKIFSVDGHPLHDIIDWRWLSAGDEIELAYEDAEGDQGIITLYREYPEDWGIEFDEVIFDGVKTCRNACTFCFMRQLPRGMRAALTLRDDDWRLSFLQGTFVTLTNLTEEDMDRIIAEHISPLRVSLHAVDDAVRSELLGKHAAHGLKALERLLEAGIEFDAQIVLVPHINDGEVLEETLSWAYERPGILNIGIVPLGFTKHQTLFCESFDDPASAQEVLALIDSWQERAVSERGYPWVYAADEFYRNAYGSDILRELPDAAFYGDYPMFEDGIGILRSSIDGFREVVGEGWAQKAADALVQENRKAVLICGEAMDPHFSLLLKESPLQGHLTPLYIANDFFGGNVNVTGLLCGSDIVSAIKGFAERGERGSTKAESEDEELLFLIPDVIFNADDVTLDGMTLDDIGRQTGCSVERIASNPLDYMHKIIRIAKEH